jgi:hypothetical protein
LESDRPTESIVSFLRPLPYLSTLRPFKNHRPRVSGIIIAFYSRPSPVGLRANHSSPIPPQCASARCTCLGSSQSATRLGLPAGKQLHCLILSIKGLWPTLVVPSLGILCGHLPFLHR